MRIKSTLFTLCFLSIFLCIWSCKKDTQWAGQKAIQAVPTTTLPVQKQWTGIFDLGKGVFASNDFAGARLNGIAFTDDHMITALITPENTPINESPWYAFKVWAAEEQDINLKLTYLKGVSHRYYPNLSQDGIHWERIDASKYKEGKRDAANNDGRSMPESITMNLHIGPDTLWISAQELITSKEVNAWIEKLDTLPFISSEKIGESREGKAIDLLKIGENDDQHMIFVLSRQHPPEVTGHLAMEAFVEAIASDHEVAVQFRKKYNTYVVPLANPDGVDHGHWRHNMGGIDLNRDWENVNQPEVAAIQQWMEDKVVTSKGKFYFGVDFHSTWEDIYYTIDPELKGNMPDLVPQMIDAMSEELALNPNIKPGLSQGKNINSSRYFFHKFAAESLTYEIGDNTPRDLLKKKGKVSALKLMELMLEN